MCCSEGGLQNACACGQKEICEGEGVSVRVAPVGVVVEIVRDGSKIEQENLCEG